MTFERPGRGPGFGAGTRSLATLASGTAVALPPGAMTLQAADPELPRERLLNHGPRALCDAELIALILGTGSSGLSARAAASALVDALSLDELAFAPPD